MYSMEQYTSRGKGDSKWKNTEAPKGSPTGGPAGSPAGARPSTKDPGREYTYEEALNFIGFGRVQFEVLFCSGFLLMTVINETMGMSIITIASQKEFELDPMEKSIMNAASFFGIFVASYAWGYLSDTSGRRISMIRAMIGGILISLASMFVSNFWVFVVLRFLAGLGVAGAAATVYAYLGEFNTLKYRPVVINYASMFVGVSMTYFPGVAWIILSHDWAYCIFNIFYFRPWRLLILFNFLPGLIGVIWLWRLPESPKLLLSHGKTTEALEVVHWIYETNTGKPPKYFKVQRLTPEINKEFLEMLMAKKNCWGVIKTMGEQTLPLISRPHVFSYLICCFAMFGMFFGSSGMGLWYPEIQNRRDAGLSDDRRTVCEVIEDKNKNDTFDTIPKYHINSDTFINSMLLGASYIVAYLILGMIINPLGRKVVLVGAQVLAGLCCYALLWIGHPLMVELLFCTYLLLPAICVSVLSGCVVDLIPTHLRGKAVCLCLMIGRMGSVVGSNVIGAIFEYYCEVTFNIFAGCTILCAVMVIFLPI